MSLNLWSRVVRTGQSRVVGYGEFSDLYEGKNIHKKGGDLAYNFAFPVVNAAAGFLAAKGLEWRVQGDKGATAAAGGVWDRSGGDRAFQEAAMTATICGDLAVQIQATPDGPRLRFLDPGICYPEFDPHDYERLVGMTIAYETQDAQGGRVRHYEMWKRGRIADEEGAAVGSYDEALTDGPPFAWIRNQGRLGQLYGRSDIAGSMAELCSRYDHLEHKQYDSTDYYLEPSLLIKAADALKADNFGGRRAYKVGEKADVSFIESKGERPGVEETLARIYGEVCRQYETPRVVFSDLATISDTSGAALRLLFMPLTTKTRRKISTWAPALERAIWKALTMESGTKSLTVRTVDALWPDPVPTNELELRQMLQLEKSLGASSTQVLEKLAYTPEQIAQAAKDNAKAADDSARRATIALSRGGQVD